MNNKKTCFVIMPFSKSSEKHDEEYWNEFFCNIKNIMEENNYHCIRSEVGPYKLFSNIIKNIEESDIVIAVLTDYNVNVWYELGIRHTLKSGTIMLLQEGQKPPFDISDFGIIFYKDSIGLQRSLKNEIEKYIGKMKSDLCDSPVIYARNGRVVTEDLEKKLEEMRQLIWKLVDERSQGKEHIERKSTKEKRILWVDDYPINNEGIINLFEEQNVQFDIAISTKKGIQLFKTQKYDLIITDMGRGREEDAGLTLIRELNNLNCETPIVVYASSRAIQKYGDIALRLGAYKVTNGIGSIISIISSVFLK